VDTEAVTLEMPTRLQQIMVLHWSWRVLLAASIQTMGHTQVQTHL
jgi:hypothetical protein